MDIVLPDIFYAISGITGGVLILLFLLILTSLD